MALILASRSPRRRELLAKICPQFSCEEADIDERALCRDISDPEQVVRTLACAKAAHAAAAHTPDDIVIGADTIVVADEKILGKPKDEKDAFLMLESLQGKTHQVYSGVTLVVSHGDKKIIKRFHEKTEVAVAAMTKEQIKAYIATGEPMDKAGSYGIQGVGGLYVREIHGDYNNVVGLPIARLYHELKNRK